MSEIETAGMMPAPDAFQQCGLTRSQGYNALSAGRLGPPTRIDGRWFVPADAAQRFAAWRAVRATQNIRGRTPYADVTA